MKCENENTFNHFVTFNDPLVCEMISKIDFIPRNWYILTQVDFVFYHNLWVKLCMEATITNL